MKTVQTILLSVGALVLAAAIGVSVKGADARTRQTMQLKLEYSQRVLEGIALEDFQLIAFNAERLKALSESSDWDVRRSADYQRYTADFARYAQSLVDAAGRKSVDAATVAFFQLTTSCIDCHRHLRGNEQARVDGMDLAGLIARN